MTAADDTISDELLDTLDELYDLAAEDPEEAYSTFQSFPEEVRAMLQFQMALAGIEKLLERFEEGEERLRGLLAARPDDADLHHQLADLLEDSGNLKDANHHFLETLRLDNLEPAASSPEIEKRVEATVKEVIESLPPNFQSKLAHVPLFIEPRPSREVVEGGLDPRSLGLFEGVDHAADLNQEARLAPTRIVLFVENLLAEIGDGPELEDEVAITVLHEVGHYFGLDEEDMERLGLD